VGRGPRSVHIRSRSAHATPRPSVLAPAHGRIGRLRDRLLRPLVLGTIENAFLPGLDRVRRPLGLPPLRTADDLFLRPPLILYMTAEPFEYPRSDWPANVVMVGPCAWEPATEPPRWLEQITRPIVLVTTSTEFQDDGRLVRAAVEGLAGDEVTVVATVPADDRVRFQTRPNVHVERFLPHGPVLERAACAVTHGGMGATQKALAHGVPVCVVPFGRDQLEVARRVEVAGAGTRLPARRLNPKRLRAKVHEAMTRTEGARRVAAAFDAVGGAATAADACEQRLLRSSSAAAQLG
jgi:MGT family glycosyltransferase